MENSVLSHLDERGRACMVDVGSKEPTLREAVARVSVQLLEETFQLIAKKAMQKGDVLTVAQLAGIQAAKRTAELIPLCHTIPLTFAGVELHLDGSTHCVEIEATCRTKAETGVEMEAMTAAAVAALTVYDMCKAVERGICITNLRVVRKSGGRSGLYQGV